MSIVSDSYARKHGCEFLADGGVASAKGFKAEGVHAGFREDPNRLDMALVVADEAVPTAAVFTRNVFCAAPVQVSRSHLGATGSGVGGMDAGAPAWGSARAVVINSGIANAATGAIGLDTARESADIVADAVGCTSEEVLVASTGVIGVHLSLDPFRVGVPLALASASSSASSGARAARAIMTTDTRPKECAVSFSGDDIGYPGCTFTVGGMSKGAGMIMPNMATMIAVLTTDAPIKAPDLHAALDRAVNVSFNKITVDSDTSTNDTCICFASGAAAPRGSACFEPETPAFASFERALTQVCTALARAMASDGEGATRLVTVRVAGAATAEDADTVARAIANSPLVKTAVYGKDANWGRIAAAAGRSGAAFSQQNVDIDIMGLPVCRAGLAVEFDEDRALELFENPEIEIAVDLGEGNAETCMWTCDFSHEYVTINGEYRS